MALYAVLNGGTVVERREIADWQTYPAHKKAANDEKGDGGPVLRPIVASGTGEIETVTVESNQVLITRSNPALDVMKSKLKTRVDYDAETCRLLYITPGSGQAMTYQEKHAQARAVNDLGETAANALTEAERVEQFPTLSASVGIEASTLWGCAQLVIQRYEMFADVSALIERARLQGKKNISDASDAGQAQAAYEAITWPTP
jgi:hypothetical protein